MWIKSYTGLAHVNGNYIKKLRVQPDSPSYPGKYSLDAIMEDNEIVNLNVYDTPDAALDGLAYLANSLDRDAAFELRRLTKTIAGRR